MKKKALGITLTLAMGISAQFVQLDSLMAGNMSRVVGMQQAEAGFMSGLTGSIDKMKHKAVSDAKKQATDTVKKALDIDMNGVNNHVENMKAHLNLATSFTAAAEYQLRQAGNLQDSSNFNEIGNIANMTRSNFTDLGPAYRYAEISPIDANVGKMIEAKLDSEDIEAQRETIKWLSYSKESRSMSTMYKALAIRDAVFIVKEAAKGIAQAGKNGDYQELKNTLQHYEHIAKEAQAICKVLGKKTGDMDAELKKIEAKKNIKAPSKAQQKQIANSIRPE